FVHLLLPPSPISTLFPYTTLFRSTNPARSEAFRQGLRELGYVEEKNIVIEWRYAEGKLDSLPALAAQLVRLKVDVIVTGGSIITDRKSTRLNSSHVAISYAVFCLK